MFEVLLCLLQRTECSPIPATVNLIYKLWGEK